MIEIIDGRLKEPALRADLIGEIIRLNKVVKTIGDMLARTNESAAAAADKIIADSELRSVADSENTCSPSFDLAYDL